MIELWHAFLNVAVVIASIVVAMVCFNYQHPLRDSILIFILGMGLYLLSIFVGLSEGICHLSDGFISLLVSIEACFDTFSYTILFAQIAIIGACLTWLTLCFQPIMDMLKQEEEKENQVQEQNEDSNEM